MAGVPTWAYIMLGLAAVIAPILGAMVLLRRQPAETKKITVDTVDVNVKLAGDVRDLAVRDWKRVGEELDAERAKLTRLADEFAAYREQNDASMRKVLDELRGEREEKRILAVENTELKRRVTELEAEVAQLKSEKPADRRTS